jgi:hypothetical protein
MTTSLTKGFPQRCPVRGLGASRRPFGAARLTGHRCATEMRTLRNDTLNHKNNVSTLSGDLTWVSGGVGEWRSEREGRFSTFQPFNLSTVYRTRSPRS